MARAASTQRKVTVTIVAWVVALVIFFPILWTVLTSFKSEGDAINISHFFQTPWSIESYFEVQSRSDYFRHFFNSVIISVGSTLLALLFSIPAAWSMAFAPTSRTRDIMMWMLSTKMMPAVGVLVPIYLIFKTLGLLDNAWGLMIVLMLMNLPIVIWMLYTYFKEIPVDILEAARMDGATLGKELVYVLVPMAVPGIASTLLLNIILAWNEAFWTLNLTAANAAPLTAFIASYSSPEGLFWAKLSAASTLAIAPILVLGWISQKQLVRGLTFGAVK
ncbi:MAG: sugar ABC transporter permease [Devosia sp. 67-54]|uniref:carbohydrate ABC transporter permease n=1 Tax=unclassified Devosia TaxID=196773 RepID=UPI00095B0D27|nr:MULTISPECIES: carbohydrate ABC transporter permease [unclassified Devosia]MBN9307660.1 carbohydrate ABC transporter permease [Devosia sp.]OJX17462.1 MAG: sugar ABC transporter permease [Devosia sp. 67-54]